MAWVMHVQYKGIYTVHAVAASHKVGGDDMVGLSG